MTLICYCTECNINYIADVKEIYKCTKCKKLNTRECDEEEKEKYEETYLSFFREFSLHPEKTDMFLKDTKTKVLLNPLYGKVRQLGSLVPTERDLEYAELLIRYTNRSALFKIMNSSGYESLQEKVSIWKFTNASGKVIRGVIYPDEFTVPQILELMFIRTGNS